MSLEMTIYVYGKCSTCQKALRALKKMKHPFTTKEITEEPPTLPELVRMLKFQNGNLKKLFNTSGQLYKELHLKEKLIEMPLNEALTLLAKNGMLVKRPFLLGNDFGITGFNEAEWLMIFNNL